jgi:hypothetical protein
MAVEFSRYVDGTAAASSTTAAVDLSACSAGDLALLLISRLADVNPSSVPAGWTLAEKFALYFSSWLYYKVLEEDDIGTVTWTWAASKPTMATAAAYTGHDADTPIEDSVQGVFAQGDGDTIDCGSLATDQLLLVAFGACYSNSVLAVNALGGWTERRDRWDTGPDRLHLIADTNGGWGGGACAPDFTLTASYASYRDGCLVAIKAAGGPTPPASTAIMTTNRGIW